MWLQELLGTGEGGAPHPARSWRLLLAPLVLLPVTLYLVDPHPAHAAGDNTTEQGIHDHSPADMPVCRHAAHHDSTLALPGDKRNADRPAPGDSLATLPARGPDSRLVPAAGAAPSGPLPVRSPQPQPVYLLTQRLRI